MCKVLGNIFLLFPFFMSQALFSASVVLRIADLNKRTPLKTVAVGQPFIVEMRFQGFDEAKKAPVIPGLESFRVQQKQEQLSVVNGNVTNVYQYVCSLDSPGSYSLGPVALEHKGALVSSNTLSFTAQAQAGSGPNGKSSSKIGNRTGRADSGSTRKQQKKEQAVICHLRLAHDRAVVGQKIACTLRLYYSDAVAAIVGVRRPELSGFGLGDFARKDEGQELIDGHEYRYIDFVGDMWAQESGKKMIPAFSVDYDVQLPSRGSFFDFFNQARRERAHSNTAHLVVDALPPTNKIVHGIGEFKAVTMGLDAAQAKEGEGITLTVEVLGSGNFESSLGVAPFELQGLSDSIKQYTSRQYVVPDSSSSVSSDNPERTCFEFIVQGLCAGKQEIPAQEFTFFDVVKKKYVTLRSKPALFTVTALEGAQACAPSNSQNSAANNSIANGSIVSDSNVLESNTGERVEEGLIPNQIPLSKDAWYPVRLRGSIPWWLFMLVLCLPAGTLLVLFLWHRVEKYQDHYKRFIHTKRAFEQAKYQLAQFKKNNETKSLHVLFISLIAYRNKVPATAISQEFIKKVLEHRHYPAGEIADFNLFLAELEAIKYGQDIVDRESCAPLFEKAEQWIVWLKKRI